MMVNSRFFSGVFVIVAAALLVAGCGQGDSAAPAADAQAVSAAGEATAAELCVVSGEKLGSMGEPIVMTHDGVEVKLCCKGCVKGFEKEPAKYAAMVRAGAAPQGHDHEGHDHEDHQH